MLTGFDQLASFAFKAILLKEIRVKRAGSESSTGSGGIGTDL